MSHQPYDSWIFEQDEIAPDQLQELRSHLQECQACMQIYQAWRAAEYQLRSTSEVSPSPGFSNRFQSLLDDRLKIQQMFQARRFMLYIFTALFVTMVGLVAYLFLSGSPAYWLASLLGSFTRYLIWWENLKIVVTNFTQSLPVIVPITLWITGSLILTILTILWIVAIWRLTIKGVVAK